MKKITKGAVVLLIILAMFFSTVAATADIFEEVNDICFKSTNQNPVVNPPLLSVGPVIFSQIPYGSDEDWVFYTSDTNAGHLCQEDFWELTEPICDIHWWGLCLLLTDFGWLACDPNGMEFEIIFYHDADGSPGAPVCVYSNIIPSYTPTGEFFDGFEMFNFETDLEPCCDLSAGWVSIQSTYSPNECRFLWAGSPTTPKNALQDGGPLNPINSLAFELTAWEEPCIPSIDVEKFVWDPEEEIWIDADTEETALDLEICTNISFRIIIKNDGECPLINIIVIDLMHDSLEFINADPEPVNFQYTPPEYFMEWSFPGPLMPNDTIEIYIVAHVKGPDSSRDYNRVMVEGFAEEAGEIVTDHDEAWVHAFEKSRIIKTPFLNWLKNHPNMFSVLRLLLQRFGL